MKYTLTVTDTQTGMTRAWDNPEGQLASWADTGTFSDSATQTPPPQGLSGRWTGTITFIYPHHLAMDAPCLGSAAITVDLLESGGNLTGQFDIGCGTFVLHGLLTRGLGISGSLDSPQGIGTISSGLVSSNRILFSTSQSIDFDGNDDADDYTVSKVSLSR